MVANGIAKSKCVENIFPITSSKHKSPSVNKLPTHIYLILCIPGRNEGGRGRERKREGGRREGEAERGRERGGGREGEGEREGERRRGRREVGRERERDREGKKEVNSEGWKN